MELKLRTCCDYKGVNRRSDLTQTKTVVNGIEFVLIVTESPLATPKTTVQTPNREIG